MTSRHTFNRALLTAGLLTTAVVEAFPNRIYQGRVVQVRQAPQTVQNVVTYDAVIVVANPKLWLKPGMTAAVRVVTTHHDVALRVPGQALRYAPIAVADRVDPGASHRVWSLRDGNPGPVPVIIA